MPTEADWKARTLAKAKVIAPAWQINESYLRQAAVSSELLTNHPAWDVYVQRLQVLLDESEAGLKSWQEKIPGAYTEADLRLAQMKMHVYTECIALLKHCMALPKEILSHAHDALDKPSE
jgi:hypothetical protein